MRPARSWYFTSRYFSCTRRRSPCFGGSNQSRITLKTYGNDGHVKTTMTSPFVPGAGTNVSVECFMCSMKSRKKCVLPCFCRPIIV